MTDQHESERIRLAEYRRLQKGEIVRMGDEYDACVDGWRDPPDWQPVTPERGGLGCPAPDPAYPSHTRYRRKLTPEQSDG